jgi:hypothetical protein
MNWGAFGGINNHVESQRVVVMTAKKPADTVWDEIFDSLILEAEPPTKYIKKVTVIMKDGNKCSVSPQDFAALIAQARYLPPGTGEIQSARIGLDFNKIKRDIAAWTADFISQFDSLPPLDLEFVESVAAMPEKIFKIAKDKAPVKRAKAATTKAKTVKIKATKAKAKVKAEPKKRSR